MENLLNKEPVKRVQEFITKFDSKLKIIVLDTTARTAEEAATSLRCEVGAIVKSLLFKAENTFLICLIAGDRRCSLNKLKKILGICSGLFLTTFKNILSKKIYLFFNLNLSLLLMLSKFSLMYLLCS